jgi:hypothetical protein
MIALSMAFNSALPVSMRQNPRSLATFSDRSHVAIRAGFVIRVAGAVHQAARKTSSRSACRAALLVGKVPDDIGTTASKPYRVSAELSPSGGGGASRHLRLPGSRSFGFFES